MQASTSSSSYALDPQLFSRIQPQEYLTRFLQEGYRPDGRQLPSTSKKPAESSEWRDVELNVGSISTAHGSCLAKLGSTTVLCGIRAEVAEPDILSPSSGFLIPNIDIPPLSTPTVRPGPPSDEAQLLSYRLRAILLQSGLLPLSSLIIEPGKAAWCLYLDLMVVNHDGNVLDAAVLAAVGALNNTRLPQARWDPDLESAISPSSSPSTFQPLSLRSLPLSFSFSLTSSPSSPFPILLCDPTSFERPLCSSHLTVVLDEKESIKYLWHAGSTNGDDVVKRCLGIAKGRYRELRRIVEEAVQEAERTRQQ